ncbi:MAG: FMN-binding glutamate synthase family protein, partial [Desulfobacterales bacterium]|nr:FMN-binding glutamate synthase family protein [Desulfobacterales bacterium]
ETAMADIHRMAETGRSVSEPMRTARPTISWDDILFQGAQLSRIPLNHGEPVNTQTIIGPRAKEPLIIETPLYITHMSFGALSREAKIAMAKGSAAVKTAMCSGEGGILPDSLESAHQYIFEYVPNQYSVTDENLKRVDAVEIKIGQSAKPGMGGLLPGEKVTREIAEIRGFPEGEEIESPARHPDIRDKEALKEKVQWLREATGGKPVGVKLAAGRIEADLSVVLHAEPDFITMDGRPGGTGAAPKFIKAATSVPTIFALYRARKFLDEHDARGISLVITGGLRVSSDFARALALGADAVALGSSVMMAIGCQQYRACNTGKCPMGIATQDPLLRSRLNIERSAERLANFLKVSTEELKNFARLTGRDNVHDLSISDLCTTNSEISNHTEIRHV